MRSSPRSTFAAHGASRHGSTLWRCRCWIRWCRRRRRCARPRPLPRPAWPASKWCTAPPAAPWRAPTSTTGRPRRRARDFEFSQTLEPLEPYRDYITIVSDTDLQPRHGLSARRGRRRPFPLQRGVPDRRASQDDRRLGLLSCGAVHRPDLRAEVRPGHAAAFASSSASRWWMPRAPAITATPACTPTPSVGRRRPARCP